MIKSFLKDSIKYLPAQVTPAIVGFISIPIITRIFPPWEYGDYAIVMATVMVLTTIVGWIPMSIIRFYPIYEKEKKTGFFINAILISAFISILLISIFFIIILVSIKNVISSNLFNLLIVSTGVFICLSYFNVFQSFLRIKRQVNWYSGFAVWKSIVALGFGLCLIFLLKLGIVGLLWGIILSILIIVPLLWNKATGNISPNFSKPEIRLIKKMTSYSVPLVFGNLAAWILNLSDRYILEAYRGSKEVGIYSASYNISEKSLFLLTTLFMLAAGPISIHVWEKEGKKKSAEFVNKVTRYYLLICIPTTIGLIAISKPLVKIMMGEQYYIGYVIFPFVTFGVLILGLQQRFQAGFIFYKKTGYITFSIVASGLLNLFLNFMLIPEYGYLAAAITTLISYAFLLFLMIVLSRRFFIWEFPFRSLIKIIVASCIMGFLVFFIAEELTSLIVINLLFSIILGTVVYFIFLYFLGEFTSEEKDMVRGRLKKFITFL